MNQKRSIFLSEISETTKLFLLHEIFMTQDTRTICDVQLLRENSKREVTKHRSEGREKMESQHNEKRTKWNSDN